MRAWAAARQVEAREGLDAQVLGVRGEFRRYAVEDGLLDEAPGRGRVAREGAAGRVQQQPDHPRFVQAVRAQQVARGVLGRAAAVPQAAGGEAVQFGALRAGDVLVEESGEDGVAERQVGGAQQPRLGEPGQAAADVLGGQSAQVSEEGGVDGRAEDADATGDAEPVRVEALEHAQDALLDRLQAQPLVEAVRVRAGGASVGPHAYGEEAPAG